MPSHITGCPWTAAEDVVLRAGYEQGRAPEIAAQLGRTLQSVFKRARRLDLATHRRWTNEDDRRLRNWWGEFTVETIAKRLSRTPATTFWRAQRIGLELGAPAGTEYLNRAAERTGYAVGSLRIILQRSGVEIKRTMSRPGTGARWHYHCVDPVLVNQAVAAWLKTEPLETAARARGVSAEVLVNRLRDIAEAPRKPSDRSRWRIPTALLDRAVSMPLVDRRKSRSRGNRGRWLSKERTAA